MTTEPTIQSIQGRIMTIDGFPPAMLAKDVAALYQVKTRQVGQAVKRNPDRFPSPEFCFRMPMGAWEDFRSKNVIENRGGGSHAPLMFTREGANMLCACLKSPVATERAVQIMRAFSANGPRQPAIEPPPPAPPASAPAGTMTVPTNRYIALLEAENELLRHRATQAQKRRRVTREERLEIIRMGVAGIGCADIARHLGRKEATVATVLRRELDQ